MAGFNLERFKKAQEYDYQSALQEVKKGRKRNHWVWYIFPQLRGLGMSSMADYYGISGLDEAKAYLADPVLGARLLEITQALMDLESADVYAVFGGIDAVKVRSCMTLFAAASGTKENIFNRVLEKYYRGEKDRITLRML